LRLHRCRICGETFLGYDVPSNCPFCGAHREHFVDSADFPEDVNLVELTESERADLEASIALEVSNARFYLAMAGRPDNKKLASAYKRLSKIEAEHCSLFCKLAGVPKPADLMQASTELGSWEADIEESRRREVRASGLYAEFAARATSPRLKEVWGAVSAVETDHIALDDVATGYLA
jgi:rubrerythrin